MDKRRKNRVFMAVSLDKYELPLAVFETIKEGAIYAGLSLAHFCRAVSLGSIDYKNKCRYVRVDLSEVV